MFTSKKIGILILTAVITPILAGLFGMATNEVAFMLSPEYYTRYKLLQYGFDTSDPHTAILYIGWTTTWWTGLVIGLVLGAASLIHRENKMLKALSESIMLTFLIAFGVGMSGLAIGGVFLSHNISSWNLPDHLQHKRDFIAVSFMHSFGYAGGLIGMAAGIIYQIRQKRRLQGTPYPHADDHDAVHSRSAA
jgi:hypothetical protein